ncbi:MAG: hypothetical protein CVU52_09740 [Deltaproteobacteria bacterium HGW-Deltaproteobacteria-10]|nr:MAG: hypothetical protein CVU52_09740 [Deltaproteobacteria bacterium HGW-Deltaproteobacteria-10]
MKKSGGLLLTLVYTFLLFSAAAFAEPSVIMSEGKYVLGDLDTKKDAKVQALIEAKRTAMEKAGTYLESSSEVKNFQLSQDQIKTMAAGIMSVEIVKEDWKMSGENMVLTIQIRATIDTSNLKDRISRMQEGDNTEGLKDVQNQLAALQKELADLKKLSQQSDGRGTKKPPTQEMKDKHESLVKEMSVLEYMEKGDIATINQRWEEAAEAYGQVISRNPRLIDAYARKAYALYFLRKLDDALAVTDQALAMDSSSVRNLGVKALILKDQPGKVDLALITINEAIKLKPDAPKLYRFRGEVFIKMGKFRIAQEDFVRACKMGAKESCARAKGLAEKMKGARNK